MINQCKKWLVTALSVMMVVLSTAPPILAAQEPTGAIEGTVTDPQGAIVQNATVTVRNTATNLTRNTGTGDDGRYRIAQLPPGVYEVRATGQSFKSSVASNVKVDVGSNVPLDFQLEVGGASEEVTVASGGEARIDRTDNTVSGVVGTIQIENLPLNGRNFLDLARLQPGAETVDGGGFDPTKSNYLGVSIAGQAGRSTQITVDGASVVDNVVGTTVQNFSQEIVQEFQVGISNYDLSTGASATGSVNVVSRSGSNNFHGNGYVYWRDSGFAAFPALNRLDTIHGIPPELQVKEIPFDREQFGGSFSGPIKKDKVFFFGNAEYYNQDGVVIRLTPPTVRGFNGFTGSPFNNLLVTGKVDWVISDKTNLFGRYSHDDNDQIQANPLGSGIVPRESASGIFQSNDQVNENRSDGFVIGSTHSFTSNLFNDFHYSYNDFRNAIGAATPDFPELRILEGTDQNWRSGTNRITPQETIQKRHQIRDDLTWTKGAHTIRFGGNWERTNIGGLLQFLVPGVIRLFGPSFTGVDALETEEDFLNAPVRDLQIGIGDPRLPFNTPGGATINNRYQFYATDQWKATRNLTLNLGLAYRYDTNLWNHDLTRPSIVAPFFDDATEAPPSDKNNLAPRVGFAWDVTGKGRTVIRGGFGMYYDTVIDNQRLFERADLGPPGAIILLQGTQVFSNLLPRGTDNLNDARFDPTPGSRRGFITLRDFLPLLPRLRSELEATVFGDCKLTSIECTGGAISGPLFSTGFQVPYSLQYAIGFQKELPGNMVFQADFNYRKGLHEVLNYDANFADRVDRNGDPLPVFPNIVDAGGNPLHVPYTDSSAYSTYKALLLRLDRRFSNGFQLTGSYTLSRLKTFGTDGLGLGNIITDPLNFRKEFGPGALDRTHRLVVSAVYELPLFKDSPSRFKKSVLGGWTVSLISTAMSGLPVSAFLPDDVDLTGSGGFLSYLPGTDPGGIGRRIHSVGELNQLIRDYNANRNTFAARIEDGVPVDPFGTPLRELAELPASTQIGGDSVISQDVRVTKSFRLSESKRFDLIGEVFNLFNVANKTNIADTAIPAAEDTATPGYEFTVFSPTRRTNNIFGTGGPRAFQFALKFTF
ncbi:MAG TPA: carboxypeptidase regulatory-like domain-containing protein [Blastocatellia bacterium]|nr:carboxypeptidase regulatory-like domain-containing protein [Blastocatellia bacterium]